MGNTPTTIRVHIARQRGWFVATSADLHNLVVTHQNFTAFATEIPAVIKALFKEQYQVDVEVKESSSPESEELDVVYVAERKIAA